MVTMADYKTIRPDMHVLIDTHVSVDMDISVNTRISANVCIGSAMHMSRVRRQR
jgi:hypothetical protein